MGTTQRTKSNGFLALPVAQKSAGSTGGGPSGEFGAMNSPRAGPNHPRGVRTEYNRRLARRRPPGGAAPPTRVRGGGAGFGVQEPALNSSGGAMPIRANRKTQFARDISLVQPPSGGCKPRRKSPASLFKIIGSSLQFSWPLSSAVVHFEYGMSASDGLGYPCSELGKFVYLLGELRHVAFISSHLVISRPRVHPARPSRGDCQLEGGCGLFTYLLESPRGLSPRKPLLFVWTWSSHMEILAPHIGRSHTTCT
jgi:hypothetical protein